jgi:hypothetical protein
MKYLDGQEIMAGDLLAVSPVSQAVVLCDFDSRRCVQGFDWQPWEDALTSGVLIEAEKEGLVHFPTADPDLALLQRDYRISEKFETELREK